MHEIDGTARYHGAHPQVPRVAWIYGWAGVGPFAALALVAVALPGTQWALQGLTLYGAVILSFLGGVHWGLAAVQRQADALRLSVGVMPALVGWGAALLGGESGLLILAAAFTVLVLFDRRAARWGWVPEWYAILRLPLSLAVVACLFIAAVFGMTP